MAGPTAPSTSGPRVAALAPSAVPNAATSFFGREREVAAVRAALLDPAARLLTLTGPGGVGKTRLALTAADGIAERLGDGAIVVPLAVAGTASAALLAIAQAAGTDGTDVPGPLGVEERVLALLRDRACLLVLDNLEHLPTLGDRVATLLAACPALRILATSRGPLRLSGERVVQVEPLPLPDGDAPTAAVAMASPAVGLFVDRARSVDPGFALTDATAPIVAEICRRLDGLPLAIELAAAWCRALGPADVRDRLGAGVSLLTSRDAHAPERHQTLRATIAWSYDLLSPPERTLLRRLAIFPAGLSLAAVEAVALRLAIEAGGNDVEGCSSPASPLPTLDPGPSPFDSIAALIDSSLLQRTTLADGRARYGLLEAVRAFGLDQLAAASETDVALDALTEWSLAVLDDLAAGLGDPARRPPDEAWLPMIGLEHENFRAALQAALDRRDAARALRLASSALFAYWGIRGLQREEGEVLERALLLVEETAAEVDPHVLAKAFADAGARRGDLGDLDEAEALLRRSLELRRAVGGDLHISSLLNNLGFVAAARGALAEAVALYEEAVAIRRGDGRPRALASVLVNLGNALMGQGEHDRATAVLAESLETAELAGDAGLAAFSLETLAEIAIAQHRARDALDLARQSLALFRQIQHRRGSSCALNIRGRALLDLGLRAEAAATLGEALAEAGAAGDRLQLAAVLETVAALVAASDRESEAARLLGAAEVARERLGAVSTPSELVQRDRTRAAVRARLEPVAFTVAWNAGRGLTPEDAAAEGSVHAAHLARVLRDASPPAPSGRAIVQDVEGTRVRLTRREVDVLRLLADGRTDREIADALYVSSRTVSKHVANILAELGVATRTAAAVRAVRFGLI